VTIALAHYQFEAVHPFLDGNGRVGRLLITLFLIERQILPTPLLYLSAFFEASRRDYYDGVRGISERGAWNYWLEYFLLGVARMSEDALRRIEQQPIACSRTLGDKSLHHYKRRDEQIGDRVYDRAARHRTTKRLEHANIVNRVGDAKRDRVYCATALLEILEEPAHLKQPAKK
jgi:Fic family protein